MASTSIECPDNHDEFIVPPEYQDIKEVFSETEANVLPPHHPYDCAIELLLGTTPPRGHIYLISLTEQQEMEEYI